MSYLDEQSINVYGNLKALPWSPYRVSYEN